MFFIGLINGPKSIAQNIELHPALASGTFPVVRNILFSYFTWQRATTVHSGLIRYMKEGALHLLPIQRREPSNAGDFERLVIYILTSRSKPRPYVDGHGLRKAYVSVAKIRWCIQGQYPIILGS